MNPFAALFAALALATISVPAQASPRLSAPPRGAQGTTGCGTAPGLAAIAPPHLDYCGGRILSQAQIVAVLWGPPDALAPTPSCSGSFRSCLDGWYQAFVQSPQFAWLDEYQTTGLAFDGDAGTGQHILPPVYYGSVVITPANTATTVGEIDIENEIVAQISAGNLPAPDGADETIYEIHFPLEVDPSDVCSVACQDFCAYHDSWHSNILNTTGLIAIIPSYMPPGYQGADCSLCGSGTDWFANLGSAMSHETIESITDPDVGLAAGIVGCSSPVGWYDSNPSDSMSVHGEIGDMCEGLPDGLDSVTKVQFPLPDGGVYSVQREWSDQYSACVGAHGDAFSISGPEGTVLGNPGGTVTFPIATTPPADAGAPLPLKLQAHGLPLSGVTASFLPSILDASATSMLTLSIDADAPQTEFAIGITGESGDTLAQTVVSVSAPDFAGAISPGAISLTAGGPPSAPLTLTTQLVTGAPRGFTIATLGAAGLTATPASGMLGTPLTFTLTAAAGAPSVNGTLSINVTSGGVLHTFPIALTLAGDDTSLTAPSGLSVQQGSSVQFTLASATRAGNPQLLSLTATNLPAGATALFSPAQLTSGQSSSATVSVSDTQPLAPISITIVGAGLFATTTVNVPINVVAPSGCGEAGALPFALLGLFAMLRRRRAAI